MAKLTCILILLASFNGVSQTLHQDIKETYDFSPARLSKEAQDKKIPLMDNFWNKVKSDTVKYLDELRRELQVEGNPKFFYFEGGQLLLSISSNINDKQIVLDAIQKTDLNDVERRALVATLSYLANAKLNTTKAALRILDDKEFQFFIPEHAFYFNQGYSLTYSLLPTKSSFYVNDVISRFKTEKDVGARKSIVMVLWFANSCKGNDFLNELLVDKAIDKSIVTFTRDLLSRQLEVDTHYKSLKNLNFDELIEAQSSATDRMSDEAIYELDYITKLLREKSCR